MKVDSKLILAFVLIGIFLIAGCAGYKTEKATDTGAGEKDTGTATGEVDVDTSDPLATSEQELDEIENI